MCVCVCVCARAHNHKYIHTQTHTHTQTRTRTHARTHVRTYARTHTHTHTHTHLDARCHTWCSIATAPSGSWLKSGLHSLFGTLFKGLKFSLGFWAQGLGSNPVSTRCRAPFLGFSLGLANHSARTSHALPPPGYLCAHGPSGPRSPASPPRSASTQQDCAALRSRGTGARRRRRSPPTEQRAPVHVCPCVTGSPSCGPPPAHASVSARSTQACRHPPSTISESARTHTMIWNFCVCSRTVRVGGGGQVLPR